LDLGQRLPGLRRSWTRRCLSLRSIRDLANASDLAEASDQHRSFYASPPASGPSFNGDRYQPGSAATGSKRLQSTAKTRTQTCSPDTPV